MIYYPMHLPFVHHPPIYLVSYLLTYYFFTYLPTYLLTYPPTCILPTLSESTLGWNKNGTSWQSIFNPLWNKNTLGKHDKNKQKQDTLNQMGHVARCYKIFFHKYLSIFNLFYDNLILEIWAFKSLFSKNEGLPSKASYLIHILIFNHQIFSNCLM